MLNLSAIVRQGMLKPRIACPRQCFHGFSAEEATVPLQTRAHFFYEPDPGCTFLFRSAQKSAVEALENILAESERIMGRALMLSFTS